MSHSVIAKEMFEEKSFDDVEVDVLISILAETDDLYTNADSESYLDDDEYDFLYLFTKAQAPTNSYFLGVGSEVRLNNKIKLPHTMGSLTQVQVGDMEQWLNNWDLNDEKIVISDKLDGVSAMIVYDREGKLQIAYSRGDGLEGQDISRHIRKIPNIPDNVGGGLVVRGEIIIEEASFNFFANDNKRSDGKKYKNARNAVAGIINSSKNKDSVYDYIKFVAYEVIYSQIPT